MSLELVIHLDREGRLLSSDILNRTAASIASVSAVSNSKAKLEPPVSDFSPKPWLLATSLRAVCEAHKETSSSPKARKLTVPIQACDNMCFTFPDDLAQHDYGTSGLSRRAHTRKPAPHNPRDEQSPNLAFVSSRTRA